MGAKSVPTPTPDVEAEITLRSTEAGGRSLPAHSGYRPQHRVLPNYFTSGTHRYAPDAPLPPGQSSLATIEFITPEVYPHCLAEGDVLELSEGSRVVGRARILRVLNPLLQRPDGAPYVVLPDAYSTGEIDPLPENWTTVGTKASESLLTELRREMCTEHVLYERSLRAVAQSRVQDDVLFESSEGDGAVYVVHLTWNRETTPDWPSTTRFESLGHFFRRWPREELDG